MSNTSTRIWEENSRTYTCPRECSNTNRFFRIKINLLIKFKFNFILSTWNKSKFATLIWKRWWSSMCRRNSSIYRSLNSQSWIQFINIQHTYFFRSNLEDIIFSSWKFSIINNSSTYREISDNTCCICCSYINSKIIEVRWDANVEGIVWQICRCVKSW